MPLTTIKIRPVLGLKNDVPANDPSLFNGDACYALDLQNVDMGRKRNAASKSVGRTLYTASANSQATTIQGLFELKGSGATDHIVFDKGKVFLVSTVDRTQSEITAAAPKTWGTTGAALISAVQYGDYIIWTDRLRTETPFKWKNGDTNSTGLLLAGTAFKFSYLAVFQRRIIGAYSDQTNGDIEIRWTSALPTWATCSMDAANQAYKPGNDSITGIKTFGSNSCFLYGLDSIDSIDYYANYTAPFAIRNLVQNQGCTGHHSIVDIGSAHLLFNRNYGFCAYQGGSVFPAGGKPISEPIESIISSINPSYYYLIVGSYIPQTKQVVWAIPENGSVTNNCLLFYDVVRGIWDKRSFNCHYIDFWTVDSTVIGSDFATLGYVYWTDFGSSRMSDIVSSAAYLVSGHTDGNVYSHTGETDNTAAIDGYRVEPAISVDGGVTKSLMLEIRFGLESVGNYNLHVYYRGGDTIGELEAATFEPLPDVSCDAPDVAVCYTNQHNMYHQIKWGTDGKREAFSVNDIQFKLAPTGAY